MRVHIPSPLRDYTRGAAQVEARGDTLGEVLLDLERQFPGIRFRMVDELGRVRAHIKLFVDQHLMTDLATPTIRAFQIHIIAALSGG